MPKEHEKGGGGNWSRSDTVGFVVLMAGWAVLAGAALAFLVSKIGPQITACG